MQYEIPENFQFNYPWSDSTIQGAFCICVSCGDRAQATQKISEYPFRYIPRRWHMEARTRGLRCAYCAENAKYRPEFYFKYDVYVSHDGELPTL